MVKSKTTNAVKYHILFCNYKVSLKGFKIFPSSNSELYLKNKESLLKSRDKPELNRNEKSLSLYLFDQYIPTRILYVHMGLV